MEKAKQIKKELDGNKLFNFEITEGKIPLDLLNKWMALCLKKGF